jgi:uncharacterized membrane protein YqaE (UPF0057 family)
MDVIRIICAFLPPSLGVFLQVGRDGHFRPTILLPRRRQVAGIAHAAWIISRR